MFESATVSRSLPKDSAPLKSHVDAAEHSDNCGIPREKVPDPLGGKEPAYPLDEPKLENELRFFKDATGIQDPSALKSHIIEIRDKAHKCFPYPCIWAFEFLRGKSLVHPFYPQIKKKQQLLADQKAIFIDFGCFMGVDLRQVVNDGWNRDNVLGVDIHTEWRNLGMELFNDVDRAPPFFKGDIFNPSVFDMSTPANTDTDHSVLDLRALKDLNELKGKAYYISAHQLFHLFPEKEQPELAKRMSLLLSNEPGSAIFGTHLGLPEENLEPYAFYLHSPKSWEKMWQDILGHEKCEVHAELEEMDSNHSYRRYPGVERLYWIHWSVVRT